MEPQKSIVLPVALAVLASAVVFGGLGYYLASNKSADNTTVTPTYTTQTEVTTQPTTKATSTITATPSNTTTTTSSNKTANWKTFTNSEYGFSFKYPETGWTPLKSPPNPPYYIDSFSVLTDQAADRSWGVLIVEKSPEKVVEEYKEADNYNNTRYGWTNTTTSQQIEKYGTTGLRVTRREKLDGKEITRTENVVKSPLNNKLTFIIWEPHETDDATEKLIHDSFAFTK